MKLQAHRGVATEYPENTLPAFRAAIEQGYPVIELDPDVTKDGIVILMHDRTINRTGRRRDGSVIEKKIRVDELTLAQLQEYDFGVWFAPEFAGTTVCLLEDVLTMCRNAGVKVKIDSKYSAYTPGQKELLFALLEKYQDTAMLTCGTLDMVRDGVARFDTIAIHYDGAVTKQILDEVAALVPRERLTVWMPYQNERTTWVKIAFADEDTAALVRQYADLGIWLITKPEELAFAEKIGAVICETDGKLKPVTK